QEDRTPRLSEAVEPRVAIRIRASAPNGRPTRSLATLFRLQLSTARSLLSARRLILRTQSQTRLRNTPAMRDTRIRRTKRSPAPKVTSTTQSTVASRTMSGMRFSITTRSTRYEKSIEHAECELPVLEKRLVDWKPRCLV